MENSKTIENSQKIKAIAAENSTDLKYIDHLERTENSTRISYYQWISRFFVVLATCSILFMVLASLALFRLAPRVMVEPLLLIKNTSSEELVSNEGITFDMSSRDSLMKMYIKQYVMLRNAIIRDETEMKTRWMSGGMISFLSSPAVYNEFGTSVASKWEQLISQPRTREVDITSVTRQGGSKSPIWKVDFKTYDLWDQSGAGSGGQGIDTKYWTASVIARFIPERSFSFYRLINPLGFTVTRYSQTEVNVR